MFREQLWDGQLVAELPAMASIWPPGVTWMRLGLASSALGTRMRASRVSSPPDRNLVDTLSNCPA
jgi:hypothetical protein